MDSALYDEVHKICGVLNPLKKPWAFTGSVAMALHAKFSGKEMYRKPQDIDIAVRQKDFQLFERALRSAGYRLPRDEPPPLWSKVYRVRLESKMWSMDMLREGSDLAPSITRNDLVVYNTKIPVIKVSHLVRHKAATRNLYDVHKINLNAYNQNNKIISDLKYLIRDLKDI